jgi:hypothetical protein
MLRLPPTRSYSACACVLTLQREHSHMFGLTSSVCIAYILLKMVENTLLPVL